ncbi:hypothetical protein N7488_005665 [Penicillium malachiteum]|nr:hypothetical protein N7488_005665 [Penicillium malachiteum]
MAADEGPSFPKNNVNPTQLRFIKWGSFWVKRTFLSDLIVAEYSLRVLVQRETMLNSKIKALQKTALVESDSTQLDAVTKELGKIHREYYRRERCLYRAIDGLPLLK